jgi:dUTP pyrophosphatase
MGVVDAIDIAIRRLDPDLAMPTYARDGDAGLDLFAAHNCEIAPRNGRSLIATGFAIAIPAGYAGFVQPRSGLALRHGVTVLNAPGLIDSGYRDELKVILINTDPDTPFAIRRGDRIAQLVIQAVVHANLVVVDVLDGDGRGGGFGSTGRR